MANVIHVNEENFQSEVMESKLPVLADFWAPWCGHCTKLSPILDELAADLGDKVKVVKISVDENRALAQQYSVMSLPTMILIKDGEKVDKLLGFMPKAAISDKISSIL
ncbi:MULTISPECIES: thioredoxin [Pelosinus]|uniref:Thioredoxin n=1 Tax=Pelosinus fermentans B4 TaxID=1149862 RepID=I8RF97_9FIRM|nr:MULTISPECIES: thioredoxin [Pelosinus]EIW18168.1 thioredoxin [Pelosinus fermentans B4]EIW24205.1 thioredoxin [Pelosinus fermentans A11]OAM94100.1 thioredoxin [Pelosinus fermentans DSM 17108]SDQ99860.1 thioredoxin [Pelosinus fermentans]